MNIEQKMECDRIAGKVDIAQLLHVLGIEYEQRGLEYWAICPSPEHSDDSPSWSITSDNSRFGVHNCFGCGYRGNIFTLVSTVKNIPFIQARDFIYDLFSIKKEKSNDIFLKASLSRFADNRQEEKNNVDYEKILSKLFKVSDNPNDEYKKYLIGRGVTDEQILKYGFMCAPPGTISDGDIRNRIVVLITKQGEIVSCYARSVGYDAESKIKVLHPKGERRSKDVFFGLDQLTSKPRVYITEGIFDAITIENAVKGTEFDGDVIALLTNSLFQEQVDALREHEYKEYIVVPDGDSGGDKLLQMSRSVLTISRQHTYYVKLQAGTDPGDYNNNLDELYDKLTKERKKLFEYKVLVARKKSLAR